MEEVAVVPPPAITPATLLPFVKGCGYTGPRLAVDYALGRAKLPFVGFYGQPWDVRSACLAVVSADGDGRAAAESCVDLGAPTALVCTGDVLEWWAISACGPRDPRTIPATQIDGFFREHKDDLSPEAIYRAKMRRPTRPAQQMWFVDIGLMPAVERRLGETLCRWVDGAIQGLADRLGGQLRSTKNYADLYKTVFWLLAAKLLNEKGVENFRRIDLTNVDDVFRRVGRHYADVEGIPPGGRAWRPAIDEAARGVAHWGHLGNTSAESLAYLYETALIDAQPKGKAAKKTGGSRDIRKQLGIHSTPPMLVDHMLAQLWPLVEQHTPDARRVFEPACGHAGFLVAAMRWLRDFCEIQDGTARHRYLRERLHGVEIDPFACELAKLQLTLADVPHGNSWPIEEADMFMPRVLKKAASMCTLLLANPPFEPFTPAQRSKYRQAGGGPAVQTKAVEMLTRALPALPPGGVFGVVMPQGVLHDRESQSVREFLLRECDLSEIAVFADNLFEKSDHEVAVLMGVRRKGKVAPPTLRYRRVRERGMPAFKEQLAFSSEREVPQARFAASADPTLLLPDLHEVWDYLGNVPRLQAVAIIQKGFEFLGEDALGGSEVVSNTRRPGWVKGVLRAADDYGIWKLPKSVWIDAAGGNLRRPGAATVLGTPQVVLNYAPVARDPWRLKAVIDEEGVAVSSRFLVFRPASPRASLRVLWAVLNSPVANAYAYCFSGKRETLVREWRAFPLPAVTPETTLRIEGAAAAYLAAVERAQTAFMQPDVTAPVRRALLALDAEVLRLYDLPPRLERQLLDLFAGVERKGVGCDFRGYYPPELTAFVPLHELISEDYARSTLGRFRDYKPETDEDVLAALRRAATAYAEE